MFENILKVRWWEWCFWVVRMFFVSEHAEAWKLLYPKDRVKLRVFSGLFMYWIYPCIPFSCKWFKAIKEASSILSHWTWSPSKSQNTLGIYFWKQFQLTIFLEHLHVWKNHQPQFPFQKKKATKLFRWVQPHRWWQSMEVNFPSSLNREKDPPSAPRFSDGVAHGFRHFSFGRFLLGGGFSRICGKAAGIIHL